MSRSPHRSVRDLKEFSVLILPAVGVAVTDIYEMKTGRRQKIAIDVRHAAATCQSSRLMRR